MNDECRKPVCLNAGNDCAAMKLKLGSLSAQPQFAVEMQVETDELETENVWAVIGQDGFHGGRFVE